MDGSVRNQYLSTEVMTATPQKLQLMVVEAAIRSCEKARRHWREDAPDEACEALIHAQACMGELLGSLNRDADAALVGKMASVYLFVFQRLIDANTRHDEATLDEALRVLHMERDTWRQVCEKFGARADTDEARFDASEEIACPLPVADVPADTGSLDVLPAGGFSLEA